MKIEELLKVKDLEAAKKVEALLVKQFYIPSWSDLKKSYYPELHDIVTDNIRRVDKVHDDGTIDKASRIYIAMEKLLVSRITDFIFSIPVKRVYHYDKSKQEAIKPVIDAIEAIYKRARIDSMNIQRSKMLYAACEFFTIWYAVSNKNHLYGFDSEYKIKCSNFSPMNGVELYPYFDEYGDMKAMTFKSKVKKDDNIIVYVETFTNDRHCKFSYGENDTKGWVELVNEEIFIGKIPCIYMMRPEPIYHGLTHIREEIEYKLSENSDTISYNSAPIIKVSGGLKGDEKKGESQRIIRTESGGDVSYVSWQQSVESLKYQIDVLNELFFKLPQMADISAAKMMSLGNIGVDARQTIFTDAHLKVGEESGPWTETFEREFNVIKAFLGMANAKWKDLLDEIDAEHVITPFIQNDEGAAIKNYMAANGGKPVISHLDSIRYAGLSENAEDTLKAIEEEAKAEAAKSMQSLFSAE